MFTFENGRNLVSIGNCSLDDAGFELAHLVERHLQTPCEVAIRCWLDDRQRFYVKLLMMLLDEPQLKRLRYSVGEEIAREQSVATFQKHGGTWKCRDLEDLDLYGLEGRPKSEGVALKAASPDRH